MWTRIGGAVILFTGLVSTMTQAIWFQGSPLIGVAFFDCAIGCIAIFSASFMTRRAGMLYLVMTLIRLLVALAMFSAFLGTFDAKTHLSHLLCKVFEYEHAIGMNVTAAMEMEAEKKCLSAGLVVIWMVAVAFVLHVTLFWYPCFRCSLHFFETLTEKEALEGLLSDTNDDDDNDDVVLRTLIAPSPMGKSGREREFKESSESVVSPPLSVYPNN
jgi:hypothetical protein